MMKRSLIFLLSLLPFLSVAQHENHYEEIDPISTDAYELSFSDQHSQKGFVHLKMTIENKTEDYLMFKAHETSFELKGKSFNPEKEVLFIPPKESEKQKLRVKGDANFHVDSLQVRLDGLYRVKRKGKVQKADPFNLPASKNSFEVGGGSFECKLDGDVKKETDVTKATFECTYHGKGVGLVNHKKVSVKTENDKEFRNKKKKGLFGKVAGKKTVKTLLDGESTSVKTQFEIPAKVVDMQFATLFIHWNDAFRESIPKKFDPHRLQLKLDKAKTEG